MMKSTLNKSNITVHVCGYVHGVFCISEDSGEYHRAIVISTGRQLCLLDIRIINAHHDYKPACFYELPANEEGPISILDLNMKLRHVYFSLGNFLYRFVTFICYCIQQGNFNNTIKG